MSTQNTNQQNRPSKDGNMTYTPSTLSLKEKASYAGYTIPEWSALPGCSYSLDIVKNGVMYGSKDISKQPFYIIGRNADVSDIVPEHPSLSRIHAVIQMGKDGRIEVMDFKSTHGTYLNGKPIKAFVYHPIHVGDYLQFGGSMRMYTLVGPETYMKPEEKVVIREEDKRPKEVEKKEENEKKYVKAPRFKIQYLGEKGTQESSELIEKLHEATWGFDDDATEEENRMSVLGSSFNSKDLTENEKRQYEKIMQLREKREKMAANKKWRNAKENREETIQKLDNQIESLEQTLYDNVEKRRYKEGHKRSKLERQLDEEDSYYDRTNRKRIKPVIHESKEILTEKLQYKKKLLAYYQDQLKNTVVKEEVKECEDSLDAFMAENEKKMHDMKESMLKEKIQTTQTEITTIMASLAKLASSSASSTSSVLRLKAKPTETTSKKSSRDTSTFTVIDNRTASSKKNETVSTQYISSIGSVMASMKSGQNHSYDDDDEVKPVITTPIITSMNVEKEKKWEKRRKPKEVEPIQENELILPERPRDMSEYTVPKDMNVAVNQEALNEVVNELGSDQPAFMRRMIQELKK